MKVDKIMISHVCAIKILKKIENILSNVQQCPEGITQDGQGWG